jgi:hypothetical protein
VEDVTGALGERYAGLGSGGVEEADLDAVRGLGVDGDVRAGVAAQGDAEGIGEGTGRCGHATILTNAP